MQPVRFACLAVVAFAMTSVAMAQTSVTLNGSTGTNTIATSYSTTGGLTLGLGFAVDALVVGGGGGGGARFGGGGGAGGVLYQPEWLITTATQTVVVGDGGTAGAASGGGGTLGAGSGGNGQNSSFATLIGYGGGGGGAGDSNNGSAGGSGGGGAGRFTTSGGSGTSGQGNAGGGAGNQLSPYRGGGGGGAGEAGAIGGSGSGAGGNGRTLSISGSNVTYGGGGGGGGTAAHGSIPNAYGGPGGAGGGGSGGNWDNSVPAVAGTANTGGGGGGSAYNGITQYTAAAGGSGIVIVRYQGSQIATGGTAAVGTGSSAGYTVHTFGTTGTSTLDFNGLNFAALGATLTGQLTGSGDLTYASPGSLTLTASNSFTGTTRATAGTLLIGGANALAGSTLDLNAADTGTIAFSAPANTTYRLGGLTGSRPLAIGDGSLVVGGNNATTTFSGALSGTGSLTKLGTGSLTLSGSSGLSGGVTVSAGSLVGTTATLRGPIVNNATLEFAQTASGTTAGGLTGTGGLVKSGAAAATISGTTNMSGAITVNAGRLVLETAASAAASTLTLANVGGAAIEVTSGTLSVSRITGGGTTGGNVALGVGATLTVREASIDHAQTYDGVVSGSGGLTMAGVGALRLQNQQTYSGPTTISSGFLVASITTDNSLSPSSVIAFSGGGQLDISNRPQTIGGLSGTGTIYSFTGDGGSGGVLTTAVASGSSHSFAGTLGGGLPGFAFIKTGAGTQTLSGSNTYTGTTTVSAGKLVINGNQSAATGDVTVAAGATLGGSGIVGGDTTIAGLHSPGNSPGVQTFTGDLSYSAGAGVLWELTANTTSNSPVVFDQILVGGNLAFDAATALTLSFNSAGSAVAWSDVFWNTSRSWTLWDVAGSTTGFGNLSISGTNWSDCFGSLLASVRPGSSFSLSQAGADVVLTYNAVPEPSTLALVACGGAMIAASRRLRRRG